MKKLLTMLLALVMVFSLSVTAFAAEEDTTTGKTITITGAIGHTYNVYQIFTGDVSTEGDSLVLSNVEYGKNAGTEGVAPEEDLLKSYMAMDGAALAKVLYAELRKDADGKILEGVATLDSSNNWTAGDLATGYYLIVDVTAEIPDGETRSPLILQVVEDVTIGSKHAGLTSEKKVDDKNDSNKSEDAVNWQDSADYDIGDAVPFKLSATLPTTFVNYATYELVFHDKQAAGFDAPQITAVYYAKANGEKVADIPASAYTTNKLDTCTANGTCDYKADCDFTVKFDNLRDVITNYAEGYQVVVEYTAVLNDDAAIGIAGNENSMYVQHPDGTTPEDTVIVFTYQLNANKIDGATREDLTGASFELFKWVIDTEHPNGYWKSLGVVSGEEKSLFTWKGIDDGKYKLVETKTPDGYNTMPDHEIIITAMHKVEWIKTNNGSAFEDLVTDGTIFRDYIDDNQPKDGVLDGDIENNKGTVLPETGAEGTAMFIGFGSLLTLVAVVFLVTRKKMSVYEN